MSLNRPGGKARWRCQVGVVGADWTSTGSSAELQNCWIAEAVWNAAPEKVRVLYAKCSSLWLVIPSNAGSGKAGVNLRGPPRKAKYSQTTDSELVP